VQTKRAILIFSALTLGLSACNGKPKSPKEQQSYTIGAQFGKSLKSQKLDLDTKALAAGIVDGYSKDKLKLTDDEMQAAMMKLSEDRQKEIKDEADKNKVKADEFLAKNKTAEGVKTTASGLQYKIIEEGKGPQPKGDDIVVVNYKGTLIDGTEFDSSYKRNQPAEFPLKGVIPGWTEGLQLMKKGGKAQFFVPPNLAYGDRPRQQIPGNAVLIFDVELLDIKAGAAAPGAGGKAKPAKK
jgi:FKBP-type peptidyl-prolyl cis-trans isomerase FkpA/FKBP-type peptidyl-prolyl cis-trans isomerase FklB